MASAATPRIIASSLTILILPDRRYSRSTVGLFDRAVATVLPAVPRSLVQRVSAPYIAGSTLEDARRTVVTLNVAGKRATIDVLGEEVHNEDEARAIASTY